MAKKVKAPDVMWAYVCEIDGDGLPIWCLARDLDEIPADQSGEKIARYRLERTPTFFVSREAK